MSGVQAAFSNSQVQSHAGSRVWMFFMILCNQNWCASNVLEMWLFSLFFETCQACYWAKAHFQTHTSSANGLKLGGIFAYVSGNGNLTLQFIEDLSLRPGTTQKWDVWDFGGFCGSYPVFAFLPHPFGIYWVGGWDCDHSGNGCIPYQFLLKVQPQLGTSRRRKQKENAEADRKTLLRSFSYFSFPFSQRF